jgi:predicted ABC-type ATPase
VPTALILGGVNGAGKSTLARALFLAPQFRGREFLNADIFAARLRRERPELTEGAANFLGLRLVAEGHDRHLKAQTSFVSETVLANAAYRGVCERALAQGFKVELVYVAIRSIEESMARVRLRVAMGGHDVPEKDIRRRWDLSHANLAWFARTVHEVRVYDNSNHGCRPALVARALGGRVAFCRADNLPAVMAALAGL